jgi:hypothetical protein
MQLALAAGGDSGKDHSHFNRSMMEAKSKGMTYVEGLQYTIDQAHRSFVVGRIWAFHMRAGYLSPPLTLHLPGSVSLDEIQKLNHALRG